MGNHAFINVTRNGHVLEVELNRPENMNALHPPAHEELHATWEMFAADRELWVAIISGAGERAFCTGNDLKYTAAGHKLTLPPSGFGGLARRHDLEKPVIGAVHGYALGGGFEIALACDILIASDDARFGLPEVKVGLIAAAGGLQRLTRQAGSKVAAQMIFTGKPITAARAYELGLVSQVVARAELMEAARAMAAEIVANSPTSVRHSKRVLNAGLKLSHLEEDLENALTEARALMKSQDFLEGVSAFAEKRKPDWKNA